MERLTRREELERDGKGGYKEVKYKGRRLKKLTSTSWGNAYEKKMNNGEIRRNITPEEKNNIKACKEKERV